MIHYRFRVKLVILTIMFIPGRPKTETATVAIATAAVNQGGCDSVGLFWP